MSADAIRKSMPLSVVRLSADRMAVCNVCGEDAEDEFDLYRAHDEWDRPIAGTDALVFVGLAHRACQEKLEAHPRLFSKELGAPGFFPRLCGQCEKRDGLRCTDARTKANGGAGLSVTLDFNAAVVCVLTRNGGGRPTPNALTCEGQVLREPEGASRASKKTTQCRRR